MQEHDTFHSQTNPRVKEVPGHLLQFEEKIFGMTLTQLLCDLGAGFGIITVTASVLLVPRMLLGLLLMIGVLILVHGKRNGYTMLYWLYLLGRCRFLPTHTIWRPQHIEVLTKDKGEPGSVQECWMQLNALDHGTAGMVTPRPKRNEPDATYWVVFEVESLQNVRYLAESEQVRVYARFQQFLTGLSFPLKFLSLVETVDPARDPALVAQREAITHLATTPHLQQLQIASLAYQQASLQQCTVVRHFVVVSASTAELSRLKDDGSQRASFMRLFERFWSKKVLVIPPDQVKKELSVRVSLLKKTFQHLDVHATLLDDASLLQAYASCLAPGTHVPSFEIEVLESEEQVHQTDGAENKKAPPTSINLPIVASSRKGSTTQSDGNQGLRRTVKMAAAPQHVQSMWKKCVQGLHRSFVYRSATSQARIAPGEICLADLVAPSAVTLLHDTDALEITVRGQKRYQRYYEVTGFAPELTCGWIEALTSLALPMVVMTRCQPIASRVMIKKLELHLVKLESQKIADHKAQRIVKADQTIEAEQVRSVMDALSRKKLTIFAVQMVFGLHASSLQRLEERASYLRSHIRDLQLHVRSLVRRQDIGWQATLPADLTWLDAFINLPSDVLCTFMNWSTGTVGTPTGAYIGTTGADFSQRPVYYNPWDPKKRLPNPHVVICGESGQGKSWLIKVLILGLLGAHIADVVVVDRDGDYDEAHASLPGESQRFNLAGACPINVLDIPYGPNDVNPNDPIDILAEFIDNQLLLGLALLSGETLTKAQEAFLTHAAREAYASKGITMEAIRRDPKTLLGDPPIFADLIATMKQVPASSEEMRMTLIERFENVTYLFPGQTSVEITCPLTIFNINKMDEKWYPLMFYVVQTFLQRHRALRRDDRYLVYVVEEASYILKHPAGKRSLESGSRGFRKLGIAQFTLSQHPADFLEEGQVILSNAGTCFFLGMQRHTAQKLNLPEELERVLEEAIPGHAVMRCGREYAAIEVATLSTLHRRILTTDPRERRLLRQQQQKQVSQEKEEKHETGYDAEDHTNG